MEIEIAARQYHDQEGTARRFHYFLTIDQEETPQFFCENYGVRVAEEAGTETVIPMITTSAARIDELIALLVENQVGPAGLMDVVMEWL
ncbi:hypothetical protein D7V91_13905 [bacterium 1xD42-67]|nr:hypothetical protein D7V91_13905 [bacterium 1xD42-67]